jgi:hypothetical protein
LLLLLLLLLLARGLLLQVLQGSLARGEEAPLGRPPCALP